jgi:hypothetical protein
MKTRRQRRKHRGGTHTVRKPKTGFRTLRSRPVGHNKPSREFRFETMKPIIVRGMKTQKLAKATKKPRTQRRINLMKNLPIQRESTTYQYIRSVKHILKQLESDLKNSENEFAANVAIQVGAVLPELENDLGMEESEYNVDDYAENIEEIREIIEDYLEKYDKALRRGKMNRVEEIEAELELIAITLDKAFHDAKELLTSLPPNTQRNANNIDELADLLGSLTFRK